MSELHRDQHKERARLLLQQRRYKDAETQAGIALQQNPNDAEALQIIGIASSIRNKPMKR